MLLFDDGKRLEKAIGEEAARAIIETLENMTKTRRTRLLPKAICTKLNCAFRKK